MSPLGTDRGAPGSTIIREGAEKETAREEIIRVDGRNPVSRKSAR